jgi:ssDNA-binding Zn-finger/Zn-ribbon topoisomerase 1
MARTTCTKCGKPVMRRQLANGEIRWMHANGRQAYETDHKVELRQQGVK